MIDRNYRRYLSWVVASPRRAAICLLLACLPALGLSAQFFANLEAGLEDLLPPEAPTVRALRKIHGRLGSQAHLTIIASSVAAEENRRYIDALGTRLRAAKIPEIRSIQSDVKTERAWAETHAPLLFPTATFDRLMDEIDGAVRASKGKANPLFVDLGATDPPEKLWADVHRHLEFEMKSNDRFPRGYLETRDGQTVVALIWLQGSEVDMGPSERLLGAVKRAVAALQPEFPAVKVAYTGDVANLIEEHDAILADLSVSSLLVLGLVSGLIVLYFRSKRSVVVAMAGVIPGLLVTFALGRLLVGHLNSNTAFLGSIIAGNGINYPLLLLAYYRLRPQDEPMVESLAQAARAALPGTLGAAATASAAYAGLAASDFRGFSQFGWLGGMGMLTTWVSAFVAVPIMVALTRHPRGGEGSTRVQDRIAGFFARPRLSRGVTVAVVLVALGVAGYGALRGSKDGIYEMRLLALRNRESLRTGSASWDEKMNQLFGSWVNPVVALVEKPEDREPAAAELRRVLQGGDTVLVDRVETIEAVLPSPAEQKRRLDRLKHLSDKVAALPDDALDDNARKLVKTHLAPERLQPIRAAEIPGLLLQGFREADGDLTRTVLIYPTLKIDYGDGVNMQRLAAKLQDAQLPKGALVGGAFLFMSDIIRLVHEQAPRVVGTVCVLVALVLLPFFWRRPGRIALVLGTVVPVALVSQALLLAANVRINMLNFAAVPITIGVGADYVLNLLGAMDSLKTDARSACVRMGGAILLCSSTTVVGYASLLAAQSGALRTFGWSAVLGEIIATAVVLLVLPMLMGARPARAHGADPLAAEVDLRAPSQ